MRKHILCFLLLCSSYFLVHSQNKGNDPLAKANEYYNTGMYYKALDAVTEAEKRTTPNDINLLYLKVNVLYKLDSIGGNYHEELQEAFKDFFKADRKQLTGEKYENIMYLSSVVERELKTEEEDYQAAKNTGTLDACNYFLSMHPVSKYATEIKNIYNELPWEKEQPKAAPVVIVDDWKEKSQAQLKKYQSNYPWMIGTGTAFAVAGAGLIGVGVYSLLKPAKTTTNTWVLDEEVNVYKPATKTSNNPNTTFNIAMFAAGGALVVTGLILAPLGGAYLSKSVKLKKEAKDRGIDLSFCPSYQPGLVTPTVNFALKF